MRGSNEVKQHVREILRQAVAAADPYASMQRTISRSGENLLVRMAEGTKQYSLSAYRHLWVVGCGKAGTPMSLALEAAVGDRICGGIVVVKHGHTGAQKPEKISIVEAAHPEPDEAGVAACRDSIEMLKKAGADDLVVAPISGGGSSLWPQPVPSVTLGDKKETTRQFLACGADIHEMNAVRKHVSLVKGGQAARYASPADVLVVAVSDVVGDEVDAIASGPFAPDTTTFADAWHVIEKYALADSLPQSVREHLRRGVEGIEAETPKNTEPLFRKVTHALCATNRNALDAAAGAARLLGYEPLVVAEPLTGECRDAANRFCLRLKELRRGTPCCLISGGETTVTLGKSYGKGGRNQEFALASAFALEDIEGAVVASCGTDGSDGPTGAAGAIADRSTLARAREAGLDPHEAFHGHNAYPLFEKLGDIIVTGPTNTNVMDVQIGIVTA
jgi:hydroxypyruvate reductase